MGRKTINNYSKFGSIVVSFFFLIKILIEIDFLPQSAESIGDFFLFTGAPFAFYGFYHHYK